MDESTNDRFEAYGDTTIGGQATAVLGNRYSYGDKFNINHTTFVFQDAPDAHTLVLKHLGQWQQPATEIEEVGSKTLLEKDLQYKLRDVQKQLHRVQSELRDTAAEKGNLQNRLQSSEAELEAVSSRFSATQGELRDVIARKEKYKIDARFLQIRLQCTEAELEAVKSRVSATRDEQEREQEMIDDLQGEPPLVFGQLRTMVEDHYEWFSPSDAELDEHIVDLNDDIKVWSKSWVSKYYQRRGTLAKDTARYLSSFVSIDSAGRLPTVLYNRPRSDSRSRVLFEAALAHEVYHSCFNSHLIFLCGVAVDDPELAKGPDVLKIPC